MSGSVDQLIAQGGVQQGQNPLAMAGNVVTIARGAQDLKTQQFNLQQAQLQPGYQAMRMLMATNPNPTDDDVNAALAQSARIGGNVGGLIANYTDFSARGGKPADFVRATALGGMSPETQGTYVYPSRMDINTGAGTYYGTTPGLATPNAGQFNPAGFAAQGFTPGQATEFVTVTGADGKPYQVPRGTLFGTGVPGGGGGGGPAIGGGGTGGGAGGPPARGAIDPASMVGSIATTLGTSPANAAAIASNFHAESGLIPGINEINPPPGNRGGYGLAQWTDTQGSPRRADLEAFARANNLDVSQPSTQLAFMKQEIATKYPNLLAQMDAAQTPEQKAAIFYSAYEGGPPRQMGSHVANASQFAALPQARQPSNGTGSAASGGTPGPFIGAASAQPVTGGGGNVQPAGGGMQYLPASPGGGGGGGGGGFQMPGVQRGPGGAPVLTPPAPWMGPIWEQSAKEYSTDVSREAGLASRIQPYQSAISIINAHPDLKTGPTSQQWNNWGSTLSQWGVQLPSQPGDSTAAYQELSKALHQGLTNSGAFSGTDMARLEAEASSPNIQQNTEAIRELSARQIGYERFQMARLKQFRSLHPGEDPDQSANQYRSQTSQWASNLDPVAFGADNLTPQEITTYRKGLTPQQDDKFLRSIKEAHRLYPEITPGGQ